jgi:twitching motility protein PilT
MNFAELIAAAVDRQASDLHLSSGRPPSCRIFGSIRTINDQRLTPDDRGHRGRSDDAGAAENTRRKGEVDFAYSIYGLGRFRVNAFRQRGSIALAARILNMEIPTPESLGIPESVVEMTNKKRGLVLVTGATGSGKSTTLASLINIINHTYYDHIITLEDPIEYLHSHERSIVNQREMGSDSESYASALRAALRQDPDVNQSASARPGDPLHRRDRAETGHRILSTLHTVGAANTIDRIIDVFPPTSSSRSAPRLADVLACVYRRQLQPRRNGRGASPLSRSCGELRHSGTPSASQDHRSAPCCRQP